MEATRETLRQNKLDNAYIRPLAFVGNVGLGVCPPVGSEMELIIAAFPWGSYLGKKRWKMALMPWSQAGTAPRQTPFRPQRKRAVTTSLLYWLVVKRAVMAMQKGLR